MSEPTAVLPASMIGRYRVIAVVGAGAMGAVVRAHDERLGRDVAIKRVKNLHGIVAAAFHARFEAEARALAALAHPGVVQIFDLGVDQGEPYLVMELLDGPSLKDELAARGPLPAAEVVAIGIQLARALEAAHARGILHRDLKPSNVVRAADGRWKLVDFGVAHVPDSEVTLSGQFLGTPAYAAPEALTLGRFSAASDVYGLAATLHEIATGAKPRGDLTMAELLVAADRAVLAPAQVEALGELGPILAAGLALAPAARPTAAAFAELLAQTQTLASSSTSAARAAALATVAPPPSTAPLDRRRWVLGSVAIIFLIGLLAAAERCGRDDSPARPRPAFGPAPAPPPVDRDDGPLTFTQPPDLDDKGLRDWAKLADKVNEGDYGEALHKLHDFERKHGASSESAALRAWLEQQAPSDYYDDDRGPPGHRRGD